MNTGRTRSQTARFSKKKEKKNAKTSLCYDDRVIRAYKEEFNDHQGPGWEGLVGQKEDLFDCAFAVAKKLCFDRLEFIAFLEDIKNQTIPPDPLNADPRYETELFRKVFSEYDEALLAEYEEVESELLPSPLAWLTRHIIGEPEFD